MRDVTLKFKLEGEASSLSRASAAGARSIGAFTGHVIFVAATGHLRYFQPMKFVDLISAVGDEPVFETGLLLADQRNPDGVRRQLARWTASGRIHQLRRGLYMLAPPWQRGHPHPFLVANRLVPGSYMSGLSALAWEQVIPEYVPETTSVGPSKPHIRELPPGRFSFRHVKPQLRFGYRALPVDDNQRAFVATPEKALLDLVHLHPGGDQSAYLAELRLDYDALRLPTLADFAARSASPKLTRAAQRICRMAQRLPPYRTL